VGHGAEDALAGVPRHHLIAHRRRRVAGVRDEVEDVAFVDHRVALVEPALHPIELGVDRALDRRRQLLEAVGIVLELLQLLQPRKELERGLLDAATSRRRHLLVELVEIVHRLDRLERVDGRVGAEADTTDDESLSIPASRRGSAGPPDDVVAVLGQVQAVRQVGVEDRRDIGELRRDVDEELGVPLRVDPAAIPVFDADPGGIRGDRSRRPSAS
jgi:hypothetical protein